MVRLPDGLDEVLHDTFGAPLRDPSERDLTARIALIRLLENSEREGATESTALRLKLFAGTGQPLEVEDAEARMLTRVVKENSRGYAPVALGPLQQYGGRIEEALKAAAPA